MFGKIKHPNEYKTFENKSIKKSIEYKVMNKIQKIRIKVWKWKAVNV